MRESKSSVTSSEMKYLRRLEGKTRKERTRNISIKESLKISLIVEEIEKRNVKS